MNSYFRNALVSEGQAFYGYGVRQQDIIAMYCAEGMPFDYQRD